MARIWHSRCCSWSAILSGNFSGAINNEWRGTFTKTKAIMIAGALVLFAAFVLFGFAGKQLAS